jgi:hypothetical protein
MDKLKEFVGPSLFSFTMVNIIHPLSLEHGSVGVNKSTLAVGFSSLPFTLINVSVGMSHAALALE